MGRKKRPSKGARPPQGPQERPGHPIFARIRVEIWDALQRFINSKRFRPKMTSIIEAALEDLLTREGFPPEAPKPPSTD